MTDNRTTELLQELRDLAADVNPSEIIDHVSFMHMGWTFDAQWLDAWHMEFDRIMQAITATLGSEREKALEKLVWYMWREITTCPDYQIPPCMTPNICDRIHELEIEVDDDKR